MVNFYNLAPYIDNIIPYRHCYIIPASKYVEIQKNFKSKIFK